MLRQWSLVKQYFFFDGDTTPFAVASTCHFANKKAVLGGSHAHTEAVETARETDCRREQESYFPI